MVSLYGREKPVNRWPENTAQHLAVTLQRPSGCADGFTSLAIAQGQQRE